MDNYFNKSNPLNACAIRLLEAFYSFLMQAFMCIVDTSCQSLNRKRYITIFNLRFKTDF